METTRNRPANGDRPVATGTARTVQGINGSMLIVTALLVEDNALAQSSAVLSVAARVVAPCTTSSASAQSTCSPQTLAWQSDIANASARISTSGGETTVTHRGGPSPRIDTQGKQVSVSF